MVFSVSLFYKNQVKKISKKNNFDYEVIEDSGNENIFIVNNSSSNGLLKLKKKGRSIIDRFNCHIRFKNELMVYEGIQDKKFQHFDIPDLIKTDRKSFLLLEQLPKKRPNFSNQQKIIKALIEFQYKAVDQNFSLANIFLQPVFRCYLIGFKLFFKKKINPTTFKSLVSVIFNLSLSHKKLDANYMHGDFHIGNLMQLKNDQLIIYDFENLVKVRKWIYIDIVRLARSKKEPFSISKKFIQQYSSSLKKNFSHIANNINEKLQLRFAIIYVALDALQKPSLNEMHDSTKIFLESTLLNSDKFDQWYDTIFEENDQLFE